MLLKEARIVQRTISQWEVVTDKLQFIGRLIREKHPQVKLLVNKDWFPSANSTCYHPLEY
jgi:hypothetical protein